METMNYNSNHHTRVLQSQMATSLQQQLAAIRAKSTTSLDLKRQKERRAQSLIYSPEEARMQSLTTLQDICYTAFLDLVKLDTRLRAFHSLFAPESVETEREALTAAENASIGEQFKAFLGLVQARLLLRPAQLALEWLVRRWRIHEHETEALILAFLPYHQHDMITAALHILPRDALPPTFGWLRPYVSSLQPPPRHAIVSALVREPAFFAALNTWTLAVARRRHHSTVLIGFWASVTAQALAAMLDSARSARQNVRQGKTEDVLVRILPVIQQAFTISIRGSGKGGVRVAVPELYLAVLMLSTILATKANLNDSVLNALMSAVAESWTEDVVGDGLACLAVLCEEKATLTLPRRVTRLVHSVKDVTAILRGLAEEQRIEKLVLGLAIGALDIVGEQSQAAETAAQLLHLEALSESSVKILQKHVQSRTKSIDEDARPLLNLILGDGKRGQQVEHPNVEEQDPINVDENSEPMQDIESAIEAQLKRLPSTPAEPFSFLKPALTGYIRGFEGGALSCLVSGATLKALLESMSFNTNVPDTRFLTCLVRIWSIHSMPSVARAQALELATTALRNGKNEALDYQALVPYAVSSLSDPMQRVRQAGARFATAIEACYAEARVPRDTGSWGQNSIYGGASHEIHWLPSADVQKFLSSSLVPVLEDCVLDASFVQSILADALNASSAADGQHAGLKTTLRSGVCTWLASHAAVTSVFTAKLSLLSLLGRIGRIGSQARKEVLIPFARTWADRSSAEVKKECKDSGAAVREMARAVTGTLTHKSSLEIETLQELSFSSNRPDISAAAFQRLRQLWDGMKGPWQLNLADWLLERSLVDDTAEVQAEAVETLRSLQLPTDVLTHLIASVPAALELSDAECPPKKRRTSSQFSPDQPRTVESAKLQAAIRRLTFVLELIEASKPGRHPELIKGLFGLLAEMHTYRLLAGSELPYLQQVLLGNLLAVVNASFDATSSTRAEVDTLAIRADLVVEAVRSSSSPQVHNTALLLMAGLARLAPESVLHSVMPLFTFMGEKTLRQTDEYSGYVIDQTIATIVPPLASSLRKSGKDVVEGSAQLLLSFTTTYEHVPLHRRLSLYSHLVSTLGDDEALSPVGAMLVERYPDDAGIMPFMIELFGKFSIDKQMLALQQWLNLVTECTKPRSVRANTLLGFGEKGVEEKDVSIAILLHGASGILQGKALRKNVAKSTASADATAKTVEEIYGNLLEQTLGLTRQLGPSSELVGAANAVLKSLLDLLPTRHFIDSSAQLMQSGSNQMRVMVFASLSCRVDAAKAGDALLQRVFLDAIPDCAAFITPFQSPAVRHAAISCVDRICEKFGKIDRAAAFTAAKTVAGDAGLGETEETDVRVISMLTLATMVEVLGEEMIPILPKVLTQILGYLRQCLDNSTNDNRIIVPALGFLNAVLDHLPWVMSARYLDQALVLVAETTNAGFPAEGVDSLLHFQRLVARRVAAPELFAAIDRTWDNVVEMTVGSVRYHVTTFHAAVLHHAKATITRSASVSSNILLKAFDLRRRFSSDYQDDEEAQQQVFSLVDRVAMDFVLKLNDVTFRPFFIRLVSWASEGLPRHEPEGRMKRALSLYSFACTLFEILGSIVTSYASFILEETVEQLSSHTADSRNERAEARKQATNRETELLNLILHTLSASFRHDQDDFWVAPQHFGAISSPLASLVGSSSSSGPISDHLVPAITDLAAAVSGSPEHLKTLNLQLMSHLRSQDAAVRLTAVQTQRAVLAKIRYDWIGLLPEQLPILNEMLEDDDEKVESETVRWTRQIEEVSGEGLSGMLA